MPTRAESFAGLSVALVTPFRDGQVDYAAFQAAGRIPDRRRHDLPLPGRHDGRIADALARRARARDRRSGRRRPRGRIKVMPGTGSNSTSEALRLTQVGRQERRRCRAGRRALLQQAHAGGLLPALQGPGRSGRHSDLRLQHPRPHRQEHRARDTIARMAELPNITMVKEATGSMDQASQIIAMTNLTVLSGDDSLTLPLWPIGGRGVISVVGNIVPQDMIALVQARSTPARSADAQCWHRKLFPALPRHARAVDQSDSDQGRDEAPRPRHRRAPHADDAAFRR